MDFFYIGKGLGKDETGRAEAIKVGVKNDTLGVSITVLYYISLSVKV